MKRATKWARVVLAAGVGLTLSVVGIGAGSAQEGSLQPLANAGDVKLHDITDALNDNADNPKPCNPVLVSFNFNVGDQYTYQFVTQPGGVIVDGPRTVLVTTDPQQEGDAGGDFTPPLVAGEQYKLQWDFGTSITTGSKQKVFRVTCNGDGDTGTFEVTKTVSGDVAPTDWAFDVHISCSDGFETDVVLSDESPSATVDNLDVGTTCTVTEANSQGATVTYSPAQTSAPIEDGTTTTITINNAFSVDVGGIGIGIVVLFTG